jgi:hypothetical protein
MRVVAKRHADPEAIAQPERAVAGPARQPARSAPPITQESNYIAAQGFTNVQLHKRQIRLQHNILRVCWFTHRYSWVQVPMRFIYVAAAIGMRPRGQKLQEGGILNDN